MRTAHAVLVGTGLLAGIGVVRLVVDHQDRNHRLTLDAAALHQQLMQDGIDHPERYADHPTLGKLSEVERANALHTNRLIAFLCAKYAARVMPDAELQHNLASLVRDPSARAFWKRSGAHWVAETAMSAPRVRQFGKDLARTFERATFLP